MGKGFENFMMKKDFHPANRDNQKRIWMKEEEKKQREQKEADLRAQYAREQDLFQNKQLLGDEKARAGLSFMYEPPPGARKQDIEAKEAKLAQEQQEYRFEWQRKYNAPREEIAKGNEEVKDQPFGIEVKNVRCIKCHQWGHVNTQRICPMFSMSKEEAAQEREVQAKIEAEKERQRQRRKRFGDGDIIDKTFTKDEILDGMEEDNLMLKSSALERVVDSNETNQQMLESDSEDSMDEITFIRNLSEKEKKKLMKKFLKLQSGAKPKKAKKDKKKKKKKKKSESSDDDSDNESKSRKHSKPEGPHQNGAYQNGRSDTTPRRARKDSPSSKRTLQNGHRSPPRGRSPQRVRSPPRGRSPLFRRARSLVNRHRSRSPAKPNREPSRSPPKRDRSPVEKRRSRSPRRNRSGSKEKTDQRDRQRSRSKDRRDGRR